jgi:predicted transcriptional regulator
MLLTSLKKIRCKHLMRIADLCKEGVSQLNGGDYIPRSGRRSYIHSPKDAYSINKNYQEEAKQWSNNASSRLNPRN